MSNGSYDFYDSFDLLDLSLSLFEAGVLFVDHIKPALATYNFAVGASFFNGCSNFHKNPFVK